MVADPGYECIAQARRREAAYTAIIDGPRARLYRATIAGSKPELALAEKSDWSAYKKADAAYRAAS